MPDPIAEVVEAYERVKTAREKVKEETRTLAALLAGLRGHPDPQVTPAAAARAMGVTKGWTHRLITQHRDGTL